MTDTTLGEKADGTDSDSVSQNLTPIARAKTTLWSHTFGVLPALTLPIVDFPLQGRGCDSEFNQAPPLWAAQPFTALYTLVFFSCILFVYMPFMSLVCIVPRWRGCRSWSWRKATSVLFIRKCTWFVSQTRSVLTHTPPQDTAPQLKRSKFVWIAGVGTDEDPACEDATSIIRGELARAMRIQHIKPMRTSGFWYRTARLGGSVDVERAEGARVIYFLHGGAYWMGSSHECGKSVPVINDLLRRLNESVLRVPDRLLSIEYRLSRHNDYAHGSYPAALLDALSGYLYLTQHCGYNADDITLMGESSGGNLALALCRYLRDEGIADTPGNLVLLSPWADVSRSHSGPFKEPNPFSSTVRNRNRDVLHPSLLYRNTTVSAFLGNLPASDTYANPYISPVSLHLGADSGGQPPQWGFAGFPKRTYIVSGTAELNWEQHVTLAHRMAQGTTQHRPTYAGDRVSEDGDAAELAARHEYPRSAKAAACHRDCWHAAKNREKKFEQREVVLDEVRDAVHVFPIWKWCEPERSEVLDRLTAWIEDGCRVNDATAPASR